MRTVLILLVAASATRTLALGNESGLANATAADATAVNSTPAREQATTEVVVAEAGKERAEDGTDVIGPLAHLDAETPYPIFIASLFTNSVFTILVCGPPRSVQSKRSWLSELARQINQFSFLVLAIASIAKDARAVWRVVHAHDFGWWARTNAAIVLWLCSPNLTKAFSMYSVWYLHVNTLKWAQLHKLGTDALRPVDTMGFFAEKLVSLLAAFYIYPAMVALIWSAPGILAYCYLLMPALMAILIFGTWVLAPTVREVLKALRTEEQHVSLEASQPLSPDEQQAALKAVDSPKTFTYAEQHAAFLQTGATLSAWAHYLLFPLFSPAVAAIVTTNARLVTGHGYWPSLADTFAERRFDAWLGKLGSVEGAVLDGFWMLI